MVDKNTGVSRQIGFVRYVAFSALKRGSIFFTVSWRFRFQSVDDAKEALEKMNGFALGDAASGNMHPLVVKFAESGSQKLSRRARLLANQSAAAARRYAAQLAQQQQQQQQQFQIGGAPVVASSTAMLADSPVDQQEPVGAAEPLHQSHGTHGRGRGGRGGSSRGGPDRRRRRPHFDNHEEQHEEHEVEKEAQETPKITIRTRPAANHSQTSPVGPSSSPQVVEWIPHSAGTKSFAQVAAGSVKEAPAVTPAPEPTPERAAVVAEADSLDALYQIAAVVEEDTGVSSEQYPGYSASPAEGGYYDAEVAAAASAYYSSYGQVGYYYQDQYGQYQYVSGEGTWYPDPNAAVYVPAANMPNPSTPTYVPLAALNPGGVPPHAQHAFYQNGYGYTGGYSHGGRGGRPRGRRGRGGRNAQFSMPYFPTHLPPFYGPQATSFPAGAGASASTTPPIFATSPEASDGFAYGSGANQTNPLYPYPFVDPTNLFVFHLPITLDEKALRKLFEQFGRLEGVRVARDRETKKSKGYGFVKFRRMQDAIQAVMQMNGHTVENKHLKVAFKSAFSDRLPSHRNRNRSRNHKGHSQENGSSQVNGVPAGTENGNPEFGDAVDSDEEDALDKIAEQENRAQEERKTEEAASVN